MVGIVLVSHSRALALSVQELVRAMTGPILPIAVAAGVGKDQSELGTDAVEIAEAIAKVKSPEGVLVLMDMGSAILSAETALDLLGDSTQFKIRFCAAPFVEGAVAAGVTANLGASLDDVCREALSSLRQKETALAPREELPDSDPAPTKADAPSDTLWRTIRLTIRNDHGLHARPAARLITETRPFQSDITVRNLTNHRGPVSVRSLSSLASLEILRDNEIEVAASGEDASAALEKISALVAGGLGDAVPSVAQGNGKGSHADAKSSASHASKSVSAPVPISGGIAIGPGVFFRASEVEVPRHKIEDPAVEIERLNRAVISAQDELELRRQEMRASVGTAKAEIYAAQILALQDPELVEKAVQFIRDDRANAALAWDRAQREIAARYESLQDEYLRERATDLEDVGRQVLELLTGSRSAGPALSGSCVLIADNLTPQQVSALPRKLVLGVVLLDGGPTAHSSILLRALGVPAIVQARSAFGAFQEDPGLIAFDGATGEIWLHPDDELLSRLTQRQTEQRRREDEERNACSILGATRDGQRIEVFANIGGVNDVATALAFGAEGVGLLRTEFLFLDRPSPPSEEEQVLALLAMAEKIEGRPLIVRTLDAGGDKELPYLAMPGEENPFLGVRAIRLCFVREELFATQLRAILRAGRGHDVRIMFPMIANITDLDRALACLHQVHRELETSQVPHLWPIPAGVMIEIPSAALQAALLAEKADFFSIGTNDLTQYTLAADRGNPDLATYQDALHPAVLRLVEMIVVGARKHHRLVAVCGEAASDPVAASVLVGLGVRELSLTSSKIPAIKAVLRGRDLARLEALARNALACRTAAEVRALSI